VYVEYKINRNYWLQVLKKRKSIESVYLEERVNIAEEKEYQEGISQGVSVHHQV